MSNPIPDWKLERYLLNELPSDEMARIQQLLAQQETSRQQLAALEADSEALRQRYPAAWMARQIQMRAGQSSTDLPSQAASLSRFWRWSPALAIALVALVALPLMQEPAPEVALRSAEQIRVKGGGARLMLHRQLQDGGSERLADGIPVAAGDLVMIQYDGSGASHGLIFSIDGNGVVTRHLPLTGHRATSLRTGVVSLEQAYELDDAPAWECFYFVTGDYDFDVESILAAARERVQAARITGAGIDVIEPPGPVPVSADLSQNQWILWKEGGRR